MESGEEMKIIVPKWFIIYASLVLSVYLGSGVYFLTCKVTPQKQKANEEISHWEQKYNEEIAKKEKVFKQHPRMRKYFK